MCQEKLVQEAVDTLLDDGICGQPMRDGHNKVYKSFSNVIEGKKGRFHETLLGKQSGISLMAQAPRKEAFFTLHLSYAGKAQSQSQGIVKLHGSFCPGTSNYSKFLELPLRLVGKPTVGLD
ncbi:hypothetical protein K1719_033453 [Acacia pycnantha]|nr:hypothetical protein K1719_033453 [Acacia pycnantha]